MDELTTRLDDAPPVVRVRYLLERGRTLNSSGRPAAAQPLFLQAWEAARACGEDGFAVDAAHMIAIVEQGDESLRWNETALALARSSTNPRARRWRASLLNNLGWTWHGRAEYARAHALFEEALAARLESGKPSEIDVARWCVARSLRSLGCAEEALESQRALLRDKEAAGRPDGYVLEEIAECLLALGRGDEAQTWFGRAWGALSADPWLAEKEPERLERLRRLRGETGEGAERERAGETER